MTGATAVVAPDGPVTGLLLPLNGPAQVTRLVVDVAPGSPRWPLRWADTVDGLRVLWCGERRKVADLPSNQGAWTLAARLGCADLADRIGFNGTLLIAGIGPDDRVGSVPQAVVQAAYRAGLLTRPRQVPRPPWHCVEAVWAGRA